MLRAKTYGEQKLVTLLVADTVVSTAHQRALGALERADSCETMKKNVRGQVEHAPAGI